MRVRTLAVAYMVAVALSMLGLWAMLYLTGNIPELETQPAFIAMHVAAEYATASMLLVAAFALARRREEARRLLFLAMGMLVYTLMVSPGYYMDTSDWAFVSMFVILLAMAVALTTAAIRDPREFGPDFEGQQVP